MISKTKDKIKDKTKDKSKSNPKIIVKKKFLTKKKIGLGFNLSLIHI